jgi:hypothetical protein
MKNYSIINVSYNYGCKSSDTIKSKFCQQIFCLKNKLKKMAIRAIKKNDFEKLQNVSASLVVFENNFSNVDNVNSYYETFVNSTMLLKRGNKGQLRKAEKRLAFETYSSLKAIYMKGL